MISRILSPLAACMVIAGVQTTALAQDVTVDAEAQMTELYKKMAITMLGKLDGSSMLVMSSPGISLADDFNPDTNDEDKALLNQTVDAIPKASPVFTANAEAKYSGLYSKIIQNRQTPSQPLTAAEKADLDKAMAVIAEDSEDMKMYQKYFDLYWAAQADVDNATQAKKGLPAAQAKLAEADGKFAPYRQKILEARGTIQKYTSKSGEAWWASLAARLAAAGKGDGTYPAAFFPKAETWKSDNGWTRISFKYGEKADSSKSSSETIKAALSGTYSWFSVDAKFGKEDSTAKSLMAHKDLAIDMEVKRVNVYRKWFDDDVLRNKAWTLPASVDGGVISYGDLRKNQGNPAPGMPLLVTSIFMVRNLKLTTVITKEEKERFKHSMDVKAKVGLGPFTLSGGYRKKDQGKSSRSAVSDAGIEAPGLQIVGFLGTVPPKGPASSVK